MHLHYPAETTRHIATILSFPSTCSLPAAYLTQARSEIIELATTISEFEPVRLYTRPEDVAVAKAMLFNQEQRQGMHDVSILPTATNHLWTRDTGPVYISCTVPETGEIKRGGICFNFNEWGMKQLPETDWPILSAEQITENREFAAWVLDSDDEPDMLKISSTLCLEGGALVSDGDGTLLVSESSILNESRNPGVSKRDVEEGLRRVLGVEKIIWFPGKQDLDVTDVHADAEVQFIRPGVVVLSRPHISAGREWQEIYEQVLTVLTSERDARGREFEICMLDEPDPGKIVGSGLESGGDDEEDPATNYVNFYFVNGGVIMPLFGDEEMDRKAAETMQRLVPERVVRQVYVNALPLTGGVIHCATQPVVDV